MAARKTRSTRAKLDVELVLNGWPVETKLLSVHEACWYVDLVIHTQDGYRSVVRQLTTDDHAVALSHYTALKVVFEQARRSA